MFTLNKLTQIRKHLDRGDVLAACKPLNELIDKWTQMHKEFVAAEQEYKKQHNWTKEPEHDNSRTTSKPEEPSGQ